MDMLKRMRALSNNPSPCKTAAAFSERKKASPHLTGNNVRNEYSVNPDKSVPSSDTFQRKWKPPTMVEPSVENEFEELDVIDLGSLSTDASLFDIREKKNGRTECHYLIHMPSSLPRDTTKWKKAPHSFNLLMVDVSASMRDFWNEVLDGWNKQVAPRLRGRTVIYTFGSSVTFRREGTCLEKSDFDAGGTDLTGALQTIVNEIYVCKERYVNIFLITDGDHNTTDVEPLSIINQIQVPHGKICSVHILGAGNSFPVKYSLDIRSRLHNGSSNIPSLFWAKQSGDTVQRMIDISNSLSEGTYSIMKLEISGYSMPGLFQSKNIFHLGEWVYFDCSPELLRKLHVRFGSFIGVLDLEPQEATIEDVDQIFRQWNSIIIQRNNNKELIPDDIFRFMERVFITHLDIMGNKEAHSINHRLQRRELKAREAQFRNELHKLKTILTTTKYKNELELAEHVLSTTVTKEKYQLKSLQLKGHTDDDYDKNCSEFKIVYKQYKEQIKNLLVTPDDCCRITMTSTLSDLQDPDFLRLLDENNKFDFLKEFTITGIPVYAPVRDSVVLNPWTFSVRSMLKSPYTIMSQSAMESFADLKASLGKDKLVQLKDDDENTQYNAVVPVFPPSVAKAMQPFVLTPLYAMCVTFSTLKNPHIIDYDIHMASLAATWVRCLFENPALPRPEHVKIRMESIEATAALYIDQPRYARYIKVLLMSPHQALMTESTDKVEGKLIKCESLIKPMFLLFMCKKYKRAMGHNDVTEIVRLLLMEYIGRCLSSYKSRDAQSTPFTNFFAASLADQRKKKEWVKTFGSDVRAEISGSEKVLLEDYYTFEKASKAAKILAKEMAEVKKEELLTHLQLKLDIVKIEKLYKLSSAGDVSWFTLKVFAMEMGLSSEAIENLFSEESMFVYTAHALQYRSSKDRLSEPMKDYSSSRKLVAEKVQKESTLDVIKMFLRELVSSMEDSWLKAYLEAHSEVVKPMTRQEILHQAQQRGIEVTDATFDEVYSRYRPTTGLLGNACQTRACPYFLIPNKSYNQHAVAERKRSPHFVHGFHKVAYMCRNRDVKVSKSELESSAVVRTPSVIPERTWKELEPAFRRLQRIYEETALENISKDQSS